jgi:hypothetical protein
MNICDRVGQPLDVAGPRNKGLETRGSNPAGGAEFVRLDHFAPDPATNSARGNVEDVGHLLDRVIFLARRPIRVLIDAQRVRVAEGRLPGRRLGAAGTGPLRRDSTRSSLRRHRRRIGYGTFIEPRKPRFHLLPFFEERVEKVLAEWNPDGPTLLVPNHCLGYLLESERVCAIFSWKLE